MTSTAHATRASRAGTAADDSLVRLRGEVLSCRILGDAFWGVAEVRPLTAGADTSAGTASTEPIKIVGKLLGVSAGDTVEVEGSWSEHPRFGPQLKARSVRTTIPSDAAGVVAWLAGKLPGIGRGRAAEIVERFSGADGLDGAAGVWHVIEAQPGRLLEIRGITPRLRDQIVEAYEESRGDRDRLVRLRGWGLTDNQVARVVARWKSAAEDVLRENPYRLAEEISGFGFRRADEVARRMGLPHESPARIRAAIEWCLENAEGDGHCYVPAAAVALWVAKEAQVRAERVTHEVREMLAEGERDESIGRAPDDGASPPRKLGTGRVVRVVLWNADGRPVDDGIERIARVAMARTEERLGADAVALAKGERRPAWGLETEAW